jgi:hypothetical protein
MKIKAYFITYKNNTELNKTLSSFINSGITKYDYEINIINNSTDTPIEIVHSLINRCKIIENNTRPSFSTGHLSRNFNECLIDGFRNINTPDCDIVILSQNDVKYNIDVIDKLIESHNTYSFIQNGVGDAFCSYTVDAIKKVGLWDERFCNIGFQECDYFLRQAIFNKNACSINDPGHGRYNNPLPFNIVDYSYSTGYSRKDKSTMDSVKYHGISTTVFLHKWKGMNSFPWDQLLMNSINTFEFNHPQYIMYPYFEDKFALNNPNYFKY